MYVAIHLRVRELHSVFCSVKDRWMQWLRHKDNKTILFNRMLLYFFEPEMKEIYTHVRERRIEKSTSVFTSADSK